jgi:DUF4097 and DUF4098 domain-containing protein YvlB
MKSFLTLLTLGALLAAPVLVQAKITRTVEKSFTVQPGGTLKVQTQGGDIKVLTGAGNEVKVTATERINADTDTKADELLKDLDLTIEQNGDNVTAKAKYEKDHSGWHFGSWPPVSVSFTVVVPAHYNVDLNTSGGDIAIASINGQARLRTSGGDLKLERVEGEVDGGTSGGNITLQEGTARVKLSTSGGDIHVERAGGEADLSTSGGNIVINSVKERLSASTSGGDIKASIEGALKGDCKLTTSGGTVKVSVDKTAAFDLRARTSGGDVDAEGITIAIEKGGLRKSSLAGKVNGGGPQLYLGSSGGDIRIRTN